MSKFTRASIIAIRPAFWALGITLAILQTLAYRHYVSADAISYLDLSDAVFPNAKWDQIINGVWSPLYPFLLGLGRLLRPSPEQEIVTAHLINIPIFILTFAAFEFFLNRWLKYDLPSAEATERTRLPLWAYQVIGYSLFLWASISQITLKSLRPDMLMAGFVFLACGLLFQMRKGASWGRFLVLGAVLGVAYLAKVPALPIGMVILAICVWEARNWSRSVPMAAAAGLVLLLIGSAYFVPLSRSRGYLTLGESSNFNYLYHVNHATLGAQQVGEGAGQFQNKSPVIFNAPLTVEYPFRQKTTRPSSFDPSYWTQGVSPRFHLKAQLMAVMDNLKAYREIIEGMGGLVVAFFALFLFSARMREALKDIAGQWPLLSVGLAGLLMYLPVHVEGRYVGLFFVLFWMGLIAGIRIPRQMVSRVAPAVAIGIAVSLVVPVTAEVAYDSANNIRSDSDPDGQAARELVRLGIKPGDPVARISSTITDLAWARTTRASIVAEVEWEVANDFWSSGPDVQEKVLQALAKSGARVVVAHTPGNLAPPQWQRLGRTRYWIQWLGTAVADRHEP